MNIEIHKYRLDFRFEAGTSRGVMTSKDSYFLKLFDSDNPEIFGIGECGPLAGLSPDLSWNLQSAIEDCVNDVLELKEINIENIPEIVSSNYPALRFALETAVLDLKNGGRRVLFENDFTNSKMSIPINGLVWMGDKSLMLSRIKKKIEAGFDCIKIKIGAINFDEEIELLRYIRKEYSKDRITIRLDANGAFKPEDALHILNRLSKFDIHSIEQPIMAGNWEAMRKICEKSVIPIALDEELIGIDNTDIKVQLLESIKPAFIVLKPTLLGGFQQTEEWINHAEERSIGWWITSALESNIGLNAIAQFTGNYKVQLPQGLGTGQLFHNNISSPLIIENGFLLHDRKNSWNLSNLD